MLLPGIVDTHVHVNEPGRTDWEGFTTATRAAAAGGVTTIIDMPLNSIPSTVNVAALELKQLIAAPQAFIDVGFWGGAVPGNEQYLRELHDAGVFGFKCFLLHSGVDEFPHLEPDELESYLKTLQTFDALMIVHAEDSRAIDRAPKPERRRLCALPGLPTARRGEPGDRRGDRSEPAGPAPGPTCCTCRRRTRCRCCAAPRRTGWTSPWRPARTI